MERVVIDSWEQLQERVQDLLERINADSMLALAAAANPILALEELGFDINPAARDEIETRFRFHPRTAVRIRQLQDEIFRHAERHFDLRSPEELSAILFDRLALTLPTHERSEPRRQAPTRRRTKSSTEKRSDEQIDEQKQSAPRPTIDLRPLIRLPGATEDPVDPLAAFAGAHPIIAPLLEYRRLDASRSRLAPRALYDDVRRGTRRVGVTHLVARLKEQS